MKKLMLYACLLGSVSTMAGDQFRITCRDSNDYPQTTMTVATYWENTAQGVCLTSLYGGTTRCDVSGCAQHQQQQQHDPGNPECYANIDLARAAAVVKYCSGARYIQIDWQFQQQQQQQQQRNQPVREQQVAQQYQYQQQLPSNSSGCPQVAQQYQRQQRQPMNDYHQGQQQLQQQNDYSGQSRQQLQQQQNDYSGQARQQCQQQ